MRAALPPQSNGPDLFRFDRFELEVRRRRLARDGELICLRPKSFDVLCCLVRKAGHPLSREELVGEVWPDVFVTDESLSRCISDFRQALSDNKQQLIKTLPRRGYVFTAPVRTSGASDDPIDGTASGRVPVLTRVSAMMLVLVSCVLFGIGVVAHTTWLGDHEPDRHAGASVAVLPFANAGGAQGEDYFAEGLAEDITIRLSKFADLLVIAPESAAKFRGGINNLPDVARQLRCRYLVLGTVRENGPKLRISARLVDIASGRQEWAEIYEGAPAQVGGVQGELAERIATMLSSKITQAELERARQKPPASLGAYDLFLRGRAALSHAETSAPALYGDELIRARDWLEQAVSLDENYGPALAALSDAYHRAWLVAIDTPMLRGDFQNREISDRALDLAQRAVAADPTLAGAHAQLAWVLHWRHRRNDALIEFGRALELNPNLVDGRYPLALAHSGNPDEAIRMLDHIFRRNPFHRPIYFSFLANAYYLAKRYEDALEMSRTAVDRLPAIYQAQAWYAASAAQAGLNEEAGSAAAAVLRLRPNFTIGDFLRTVSLANEEQSVRLEDGLLKAGLPR